MLGPLSFFRSLVVAFGMRTMNQGRVWKGASHLARITDAESSSFGYLCGLLGLARQMQKEASHSLSQAERNAGIQRFSDATSHLHPRLHLKRSGIWDRPRHFPELHQYCHRNQPCISLSSPLSHASDQIEQANHSPSRWSELPFVPPVETSLSAAGELPCPPQSCHLNSFRTARSSVIRCDLPPDIHAPPLAGLICVRGGGPGCEDHSR